MRPSLHLFIDLVCGLADGCRPSTAPSLVLPSATRSVLLVGHPQGRNHVVELRPDGSGLVDGSEFAAGDLPRLDVLITGPIVLFGGDRPRVDDSTPSARLAWSETRVRIAANTQLGAVVDALELLARVTATSKHAGGTLRLELSASESGRAQAHAVPLRSVELDPTLGSGPYRALLVWCASEYPSFATAEQPWSVFVDASAKGVGDEVERDTLEPSEVAEILTNYRERASADVHVVALETTTWQEVIDLIDTAAEFPVDAVDIWRARD